MIEPGYYPKFPRFGETKEVFKGKLENFCYKSGRKGVKTILMIKLRRKKDK